MAGRMSRQAIFLKDLLNEANNNKRQQKFRYANTDQINAISELVMNILKGNVRQGRTMLSRLKLQTRHLRKIASLQNSMKTRRQFMMHQLGGGVWQELKHCYYCAKKQYRY